jgi:diaminobutyrate-2-oxoglutarate transaminase
MTDFSKFHLADDAMIVTNQIPGAKSAEMIEQQMEIEGSVVSYPRSIPIAIKRAKGAIIEDVDGNLFIDFFAGAGVLNLGHSNEEILEPVIRQQRELIHALDFPTQNKLNAIQRILNHLPVHLRKEYKVSFGGPTGSDAVEAAIKLAKIKTGRDTVIAFSGGYHGMSSAALALTSDVNYRKKLHSLVPNIHFAPFSYCYRCPFKQDPKTCSLDCVEYLQNIIENNHSGVAKPAAIIVEPIQGEGGNIPFRAGYLEALVDLARRNDIVVIFDEIQSGFFRSGQFLSFMNTNAVPDIVTISKGIGGIGLPLSGLIYRRDVEAWGPGDHIGTFRGNQASLAATNAAFSFVEKYGVAHHAIEMGAYLMKGLEQLKADFKYIGDVRGIGLMIGVELVKDRASKSPYPEFIKEFKQLCLQRGLLFEIGGHYGNVIRLVPPLIITKKIIDNALRIMRTVFEIMDTSHLPQELNGKMVEFAD